MDVISNLNDFISNLNIVNYYTIQNTYKLEISIIIYFYDKIMLFKLLKIVFQIIKI